MIKELLVVFLGVFLFCGLAYAGDGEEYASAIQAGDHKVVLEKYSEAQKDYKAAMKVASNALQKAYVHYKLGQIHKKRQQTEKANNEWKQGLASLAAAGLTDHDMHQFLSSALKP